MKPMLRPSTNIPFNEPVLMYVSASSFVKNPLKITASVSNDSQATIMYLCLSKSTKHTAMQPSTLRMRLGFFFVVICSTSLA